MKRLVVISLLLVMPRPGLAQTSLSDQINSVYSVQQQHDDAVRMAAGPTE
jgi:hypothetical protein